MKFYDALTKNTIRDNINRICGTTDAVYTLRDKLANVDNALDDYWFLAVNSASKASFDDTGQTSLPVETQSLVSGTNNYKLSSFSTTNEVLQILRISVLDDGATEQDLIREDFDDIVDFTADYDTDITGVPTHWTKMGDYIYLRPCPNYAETDGLRAYVNRELSKFSNVAFTITIAAPGVATAAAHGLSDSDTVLLSTNGTIPTGLTKDTTVYYLVNKATDTFQLTSVPAATGITTSGTQTGTHGFFHLSKAPGIQVNHHIYLVKHAALAFMDQKHPKFQKTAIEVQVMEEKIKDYWRTMEGESNAIIKPKRRCFK